MKSVYMLSIITENTLEIIPRLAVVFSRHRLLINNMDFKSFNKFGDFLFQVEIYTDKIKLERVIKQLQKIIELVEVRVVCNNKFQNNSPNNEVYLC